MPLLSFFKKNVLFLYTIVVFIGCNENSSNKVTRESKKLEEKHDLLSFEEQENFEQKFKNSAPKNRINQLYRSEFCSDSRYLNFSIQEIDLNRDGKTDKILKFEGMCDGWPFFQRMFLFKKENGWKKAGFITQSEHNQLKDSDLHIVDTINRSYFYIMSEGWGSCVGGDYRIIYKIENDSILSVLEYPEFSWNNLCEEYVGDGSCMESFRSEQQFLNDSSFKISAIITYERFDMNEKILFSQSFEEEFEYQFMDSTKSFVMIKSTNPNYEGEIIQLSYSFIYKEKLNKNYFKFE